MHDDETNAGSGEWTAEEAAAFAALPREAGASDVLAERTVQALRAEGLVHEAPKRRSIRVTPLRIFGALAACLVLFVGGFAIGRRSPAGTGGTPLEQQAASYLAALDAAAHDTSPEASAAAQAVARATLQAAAESMLRLYPDDAFAARILQAQDVADATKTAAGAATHQRIVWF